MQDEVHRLTVHTLVFRSLKRSHDMFLSGQNSLPQIDEVADDLRRKVKARDNYGAVFDDVKKMQAIKQLQAMDSSRSNPTAGASFPNETEAVSNGDDMVVATYNENSLIQQRSAPSSNQNLIRKAPSMPKPKWHAPWKLFRVISGHLGWVTCCAVEPNNEWFATGAADRIIKVWNLGSGQLKVSLTGHVGSVKDLAVSARHQYLFSCGDDRQVKCWDLEYNKVIRHYHGHLSAVYSLALHPTLDVLVTAGRDSTARVWDMRTKANIHTLQGHTNTVASVICQASEPQVVTGSHDTTIRLWDLQAGKSMCTLTNHKKSVRSVIYHPVLNMFASGSPDNIKQWRCPDGKFIQNVSGHNAIVNCLAINEESVLVSGGDNGTLFFWDWRTGYNFQRLQAPVQPGSMDSEAAIFSMTFDKSGSRLITTDADKTIKIYREDEAATEEEYPINWKPDILKRRKY